MFDELKGYINHALAIDGIKVTSISIGLEDGYWIVRVTTTFRNFEPRDIELRLTWLMGPEHVIEKAVHAIHEVWLKKLSQAYV